ncbi:5-oxoprolinase [Henriciella barbarensis]|uniref:5-oxoprolinase n=1 Tax=Henriciella barbarensis TaxID=86342 RepID=A0A399R3Z0_9PROT|nr:hydantoinase B/oxoprolinase family protein [Henriciella barbarensis]RIJ24577.1 5-oxoprolinase [Henriciella barbarensis]
MSGWQFWIDRGGTFTDIVARTPEGRYELSKLLSENPGVYEDAAIEGIRRALDAPAGEPLPFHQIDQVRMGTTVATNALLERKGAPTLFVVNEGFGDLLIIGRQSRPRLFDLHIKRPAPLNNDVLEVAARIDLDGEFLKPLDEAVIVSDLSAARSRGLETCAVSLLHAWKHPDLEKQVGALARKAGFKTVALSHEADPLAGYVARAATAVADAYLTPVLQRYVEQVASRLGETSLHFMQSNGGLMEASRFRGRDAVLSGPAGGVVGAAKTAALLGHNRIIGFDMGGTSTDISVYDGQFERVTETEVAGAPLRVPMMDIHTVAAGGGSVLRFDQGQLQAGPQSAGADPGPTAYRRGGPLTVTDANILLGRIQPSAFPPVFGPEQDQPLDLDAVRTGFDQMAREVEAETGLARSAEELAAGFLQIAVANMARAIRKVTLEKGRDPADFALQAFGGAGGQHACLVADELDIQTVIIHPLAGVLSALGIGLSDEIDIARTSVEETLDDQATEDALGRIQHLKRQQRERLGADNLTWRISAAVRYAGTDTSLRVEFGDLATMRKDFERLHEARFGFRTPDRTLVLESLSCEARRAAPDFESKPFAGKREAAQDQEVELWSRGEVVVAPLIDRSSLAPGSNIVGPALITEDTGTTVIDAGWSARVAEGGELVMQRVGAARRELVKATDTPDPVLLSLFNNMFMAIAERMGAVLRDTATSVNIKERLDFSCAVFDDQGRLLANAPHMPVHLGAMGESVRTVLESRGATLKPGDMICLNNPFNGGTHLPDITVIAPVFDKGGKNIWFFVANRGHHADIGGLTPGSTPARATKLEQEGVVIDDFLLLSEGEFREDALRRMLADAPWPARKPDQNVADLRAQMAANIAGSKDLLAMIERYGRAGVTSYAGHVLDNAEESVRRVIDRLSDGEMQIAMDDGLSLCVSIKVDREARSATIDFSGTGPQRPGNFNAPPVVCRSAVLYAFRCLVEDELPLNEGCMRPLELVIPEGSFLSPSHGAAVVAGNTEVSQAVCNVIFGAMGVSAAAQGTMNNLLFGNDDYQYYETICGGSGAGPGFDGTSGVHTHMTNTRITDPEVMEMTYPLRLERFSLRGGSGGAGKQTGGDGVVRTIRALSNTVCTLVSSSRQTGPFGLEGGGDANCGRQWIVRADGRREGIDGVVTIEMDIGDTITIETPGGGGYGALKQS